MYVDDTSLSFMNDNLVQPNEALNTGIESLDEWLKGNRLSLNVTKTKSMAISTKPKYAALRHQTEHLCLIIRDNTLVVVQSTTYLGVHINNALEWKNHIQEITKNISHVIKTYHKASCKIVK